MIEITLWNEIHEPTTGQTGSVPEHFCQETQTDNLSDLFMKGGHRCVDFFYLVAFLFCIPHFGPGSAYDSDCAYCTW